MSDDPEKPLHQPSTAQSTSVEAEARYLHQQAEHRSAPREAENTSKQIVQAHQEWMSALDAVEDPIVLYDKEFRILRCNRAYQRSAGIPYKQIIGRPYYEVFPKTLAPLPSSLQALENGKAEEKLLVGDTVHRSRVKSVMDERGNYLYSVHTLENFNEGRRTHRVLQDSEVQYRRLFEGAKDGILILDAETGKVVDANPFILDLLSYSLSECTGKMLWELGLFKDIASSKAAFRELRTSGYVRHEDLPLRRKDGRQVHVEFISNLYEVGERQVVQCHIRDVTETLRAKELLIASRDLVRNIVENIPIRVFWKDTELRFLGCNTAFAHDAGMSRPEDLVGKDDFQTGWREQADLYRADDRRVMDSGIPMLGYEEQQTTPDGDTIWLRTSKIPLRAADGNIFGLLGIYENITERKRAEARLKESEQKFRAIFDHARDGIIVMNTDSRSVVFANTSMEQMLGYGPGELVGLSLPRLHPPEALARIVTQFESDTRGGQSNVPDMPMTTKDGRLLYADLNGSPVDIGGQRCLLGIFRDATERRAGELRLHRAIRAHKTLSAANRALVQNTNEDELLQAVTRVIVEQGGYAEALVDYAQDDPGKSLTPKAWSGFDGDRYWAQGRSWADTEPGQLPISNTIRSGKTQVCHDISSDPAFKPWRNNTTARGYVSNIALPLSDGERTFGGLSIYTSEASAFDDEEIRLLEELANDLAYGIVNLRTRREHEQHATILRQSLEQSIQTIADTVEARDPYTAGHQRRVAELATAIAREMGLPEEQINGIHLAAIIHDVGKIHVPAEILARPGKLTEIEMMLVHVHPQAGYDILKDVKFPWPIADIILQHHEKLNGSGYPQGLKGGQILLESRILTVADVVEAMSSHRPYRASQGIALALDEIRRGRGSEYDPVVVDACLKLFSENRFTFTSQISQW